MGLNDAINSVRTLTNISSITDVAKMISVAPQDFQGGIGGFLFSIPLEEAIDLQSQITDYLIEENSSIEDNIALSPLKLTLSGVVAELVYSNKEADLFFSALGNKLGALDIISPNFSMQMQSYLGEARTLYEQLQNAYEASNDIYNQLKDAIGENIANEMSAQQKAFNFFYSTWRSRNLVTVETPWAIFGDCALENVSFKQGSQSTEKTELSVTIKVLNFAKTKSSLYFGVLGGRSAGQATDKANTKNGTTTQTPQKQQSDLYALANSRKQSSYGVSN